MQFSSHSSHFAGWPSSHGFRTVCPFSDIPQMCDFKFQTGISSDVHQHIVNFCRYYFFENSLNSDYSNLVRKSRGLGKRWLDKGKLTWLWWVLPRRCGFCHRVTWQLSGTCDSVILTTVHDYDIQYKKYVRWEFMLLYLFDISHPTPLSL